MRKCDLNFQALCQICLWGHVFPLGLLELLIHIPVGNKQGRCLYVMNKTQSHGKEGCSSYLILYQCNLHGQFPSLLDFIVLGQLHWSSATTYDGPIQMKDNFESPTETQDELHSYLVRQGMACSKSLFEALAHTNFKSLGHNVKINLLTVDVTLIAANLFSTGYI